MERERNKITSVCVYCASSTQVASAYREAATELGRLLGERNLRVINGAGNSGLMCAVSDATLAAGGTVTGVIPRFMVEQDWCHKGLTDLVEVYLNPIVILNINGYFDPLLEMFRRAVDEHFMRPQHAALWAVASTPAEAVELIYAEPVWDASLRKQALV